MKESDSNKSREHVRLLLRKAAQDEYVLDALLNDPASPIEIFGFHCQQAVEKLLKAALVCSATPYPRTHRLAELIDLLVDAHVPGVIAFDDLRILTPFAVEFRYDVLPVEGSTVLDRQHLRGRIHDLRTWVESFLQ